jgi:bacterioferritin
MGKGSKMAKKDSGNSKTVEMLQKAFRMEVETVINYLANSIHLDGMRAEEVKRSLGADITEELGHATRIAQRIKQLRGRIPGSLELKFDQKGLRPPQTTTDVKSVVVGVIEAEKSAIEHYRAIIEHCEQSGDPVTVDLATELLGDEEEHRSQFEGFYAEIELGT